MDHPMKEPPPHVEERPGAPPKRIRTGGRSARVLEQVVAAARDELREHGAVAFSIPRVAKRAGVHVASVYRRWPDVNELIAFTANRYVDQLVPVPDSGSLMGDVSLLLQGTRAFLCDPLGATLVGQAFSLSGEGANRALIRLYWSKRAAAHRAVFERAVARGELHGEVDPEVVVEMLVGPLYIRHFLSQGAISDDYLRTLAERVLAPLLVPRG